MKLIGLMPVRNEDWVLGLSLRAALMWCDEVIVLDHASEDRTPEILHEIAGEASDRLVVMKNSDKVWREMAHRQSMLDMARKRKASHIALVDADEVLTGNILGEVRKQISILPDGQFIRTRMFCMWRSLHKYRNDRSVWSNQKGFSLAFKDYPSLQWQTRNGYDHHQRVPNNAVAGPQWLPDGGVMHLQFASWRRLTAKHAHYKIIERTRWPDKSVATIDKIYNQALDESNLALSSTPREWWEPYQHLMCHVRLEHEPWQEKACRDAVATHGHEKFAGLNLFGVV